MSGLNRGEGRLNINKDLPVILEKNPKRNGRDRSKEGTSGLEVTAFLTPKLSKRATSKGGVGEETKVKETAEKGGSPKNRNNKYKSKSIRRKSGRLGEKQAVDKVLKLGVEACQFAQNEDGADSNISPMSPDRRKRGEVSPICKSEI